MIIKSNFEINLAFFLNALVFIKVASITKCNGPQWIYFVTNEMTAIKGQPGHDTYERRLRRIAKKDGFERTAKKDDGFKKNIRDKTSQSEQICQESSF